MQVILKSIEEKRIFDAKGMSVMKDSRRSAFYPERVEVTVADGTARYVQVIGSKVKNGHQTMTGFSVKSEFDDLPAWLKRVVESSNYPASVGVHVDVTPSRVRA